MAHINKKHESNSTNPPNPVPSLCRNNDSYRRIPGTVKQGFRGKANQKKKKARVF